MTIHCEMAVEASHGRKVGSDRPILHCVACLLLLLLTFTGIASAAEDSSEEASTVLHVDDDAPSGGDGLTWATAYRFLQDALAAAREPGSGVVEIRIAGGVYKPDRSEAHPEGTGDRDVSFDLVSGVALRGGYAGFGSPDPDFRSLELFETIFSGDLAGDDGPPGEFENDDENSHYVVRGSELTAEVLLEGLVLTAGNNDIILFPGELPRSSGAAMNVVGGELTLSWCRIEHNRAYNGGGCYLEDIDVTFLDSVIAGNRAFGGVGTGGGMSIRSGQFSFADCLFLGNSVTFEDGGGLISGFAAGEIRRTVFEDNSADDGGGASLGPWVSVSDCLFISNHSNGGGAAVGGLIYENCQFIDNTGFFSGGALRILSLTTVTNCTFRDNIANSLGGVGGAISGGGTIVNCTFEGNQALENGGALNLDRASSVVNCVIRGNSADQLGGGVFVDHEEVSLVNCTIVENQAGGGGAVVGAASMANCIVWGNLPDQLQDPGDVRYSCIQGGWSGEGIIAADPLFEGLDDLRLKETSPCIDAGDTSALPSDIADLDDDGDVTERVPFDLAGDPRLTDRPATPDTGVPVGSLPVVDMGALEFQPIVFGDLDGDGRIGLTDLLLLLDAWGSCPARGFSSIVAGCIGDLDRDGQVGSRDLLLLLAAW